jgi:hypothetical protein
MAIEDDPEVLAARMARAVEAEDYEEAARLRDRLSALQDTAFTRQVPGRMGLGTSEQVFKPPEGWKPPKKPDLMTANVKPRGGRKG